MLYNFIHIAFAPAQGGKGNNDKNTKNLTAEEQKKMHDAYSEMGKKGGKIGGNVRKEQMAKEGTYTHKEESKK